MCILDGLDECLPNGRIRLIDVFTTFYTRETKDTSNLKILVTSRPYYTIERNFEILTDQFPKIRLAGEDESDAISKEIDLVITAQVANLVKKLRFDDSERILLESTLHNTPNRTYLWVHLVLKMIEDELEVAWESHYALYQRRWSKFMKEY